MSSGKFFLVATISLGGFFALPSSLTRAQVTPDAAIPVPDVENSKYQAAGVINSNGVQVRSGAGENYYATARVDKSAPVTIVGIRFDWLKIVPPEGSFSYVAKAYVEKRGDGTVGRVTRPDLNVRAGSSLNAIKTAIQTKLNEGDDVQIIGEADEYFKIKPPTGAFLYVNKQYVDAVSVLGQNPQAPANTGVASGDTTTGAPAGTSIANSTTTTDGANLVAPGATTQATPSIAATPAVVSKHEQDFAVVEERFKDASTKPLDQQPLAELIKDYTNAISSESLPESLKRIADQRLAVLKARLSTQTEFAAAKQRQAELEKRQLAMNAEREELQARLKEQEKHVFAAIGTLRTSSLQQGAGVLFRITDPANGRTLVYIRSNEPNLASMIGHFVGVRGTAATDASLNINVIAPTAVEEIPEANVGKLAAQIMPPSMIASASQAGSTEAKP